MAAIINSNTDTGRTSAGARSLAGLREAPASCHSITATGFRSSCGAESQLVPHQPRRDDA